MTQPKTGSLASISRRSVLLVALLTVTLAATAVAPVAWSSAPKPKSIEVLEQLDTAAPYELNHKFVFVLRFRLDQACGTYASKTECPKSIVTSAQMMNSEFPCTTALPVKTDLYPFTSSGSRTSWPSFLVPSDGVEKQVNSQFTYADYRAVKRICINFGDLTLDTLFYPPASGGTGLQTTSVVAPDQPPQPVTTVAWPLLSRFGFEYTKSRFGSLKVTGITTLLPVGPKLEVACVSGCPRGRKGTLVSMNGPVGSGSQRRFTRALKPKRSTRIRVWVTQEGRISRARDFRFQMSGAGRPVQVQTAETCFAPGSRTQKASCS